MAHTRRRLRSSTVVLGGMGVVAAALTSCGSEPDRRCVDRDSYDLYKGYRIISDDNCEGYSSNGEWYYDGDIDGSHVQYGSFSRSEAVDRGGFGCSASGSGGG
ncbi:hypothetical protein [Streptomyces sp. DH24]|uniref:hypothetical protein n=1 Tax=Streptomyces sp. DH24 TaxID=3040123 RepID=UPI00244319C1|nr:hypothetical protein [Streptomyces sp. DH24]MDG9720789.1 hypothetical protein [Streptomyces sp. DH24]